MDASLGAPRNNYAGKKRPRPHQDTPLPRTVPPPRAVVAVGHSDAVPSLFVATMDDHKRPHSATGHRVSPVPYCAQENRHANLFHGDGDLSAPVPSRPCKFFLTAGGCRSGTSCTFSHGGGAKSSVALSGAPARPGQPECAFFSTPAGCWSGNACAFRHGARVGTSAGDRYNRSSSGSASASLGGSSLTRALAGAARAAKAALSDAAEVAAASSAVGPADLDRDLDDFFARRAAASAPAQQGSDDAGTAQPPPPQALQQAAPAGMASFQRQPAAAAAAAAAPPHPNPVVPVTAMRQALVFFVEKEESR